MTHEAEPHLTILAPSLEQRPPKERQLSLAFPISNYDKTKTLTMQWILKPQKLPFLYMRFKCLENAQEKK